RALSRDPDLAEAHRVLALLHFNDGQLGEELAELSRAVELRPTDGRLLGRLGAAQSHSNDYAAALETLSRAVELDPRNSDAATQLGLLYMLLGRYREAAIWLDRATAIEPRNGGAYLWEAWIMA